MNVFAKLAVLRNLALGFSADAHLKTDTELRIFPQTLAALRAEGLLDRSCNLTDDGRRQASYAVRRLSRLPFSRRPDKR